MTSSCRVLFSLLAALLLWRGTWGQEPRPLHRTVLSGESKALTQRLEAIDRLIFPEVSVETFRCLFARLGAPPPGIMGEAIQLALEQRRQQKWEDALAECVRLIDEAGEELAPLAEGGEGPSVLVRRLCQERMILAPSVFLRPYRERVDRSAKRWLDEGIKDRDPTPLRRIIAEARYSQHAEQALDLLGDLAFEKGNFNEAIQWWQMLDGAKPHAKRILAHIFSGEKTRAAKELIGFGRIHAHAEGHLAGRKGKYVEILRDWLAKLEAGKLALDETDWPTFGGSLSRNRISTQAPHPRLWAEGPAWGVGIETGEKLDPSSWAPPYPNSNAARRLAYHPIIVGDRVLVASADSVSAFRVSTGERLFRYEHPKIGRAAENAPDVRFTLSATADRVYARLGCVPLTAKKDGPEECKTHLVCLNLHDGSASWSIEARGRDGEPAFFEGAPLTHEGRVFIALSRLVAGRTVSAIACYEGATGTLVWHRDVCDVPELEGSEARVRHHLLTLAGTNLVYCSHSGAVVALDTMSGSRQWALRYPSRGVLTADRIPSPRDLCPALFNDGRLFIAPVDADRLLCVDKATGRILWQRERIEVVHVLGAANGLVYLNTTTGLHVLRTETGLDDGGWFAGQIKSFGRGFLAGSRVYWPTQQPTSFLALSLTEGLRDFDPTQLSRLWGGNTAFANGCLAVADADSLFVYLPPERMPNRGEPNRKLITTRVDRDSSLSLLAGIARPNPTSKTLRVAWEGVGEHWLGLFERETPTERTHFVERAGRLSRLDSPSGKPIWTHEPALPTALTGEPIRVVDGGEVVLLSVPRNHGYELDRLDPNTGQSLWRGRGPQYRARCDAIIHNDKVAHLVVAGILEGRSVQDGRLLWKQDLPATRGSWNLMYHGRLVLAFPKAEDQPSWTWTPLGDCLLSLPRTARTNAEAFPLLVFEAGSGRLADRLNFSPTLSHDNGLRVARSGSRLIVACGNRVWALEGNPRDPPSPVR